MDVKIKCTHCGCNDLEEVDIRYSYDNKYLRHDAKIYYEKMASDVEKLGYKIVLVSAYRNYKYQADLYQEYVDTMGIDYAKMCSAEAGHSEHQTGLAIDIMGSKVSEESIALSDFCLIIPSDRNRIIRNTKNRLLFQIGI